MSNEYEATIRDLQTSVMRLQEENARLAESVESWVRTAERFSINAYKAQCETNIVKNRIRDIKDTITIEGPYPKVHRKVLARHRREWPTLWKAINGAIEVLDAGKNND